MGKTIMATRRLAPIFLLIVSLLVYASFGLANFGFILIGLFTSYLTALYLTNHQNKIILTLAIILNASVFLLFKITPNVTIKTMTFIAPVGLAYYTLQVISYLIDVYRGKYQAERNLLRYGLYIFYFPILLIGPINRYDNFNKALDQIKITLDNIYAGLLRILWGLFKKLVIAGRLTLLVNSLTNYPSGGAFALLACFSYAILLYADFSGGIDIVLGFSRLFGLMLPENFDHPYFKNNIKSFWNAWHMSLSNWLKDYIYIPLGGNRKGKIRTKINIIITFFVSGLWHGLNYLVWGLCHGLLVAFPNFLRTKWPRVNHFITIVLVSLLWAFFVYNDTFTALKMLASIFTTFNYQLLLTNIFNFGLNGINYLILIWAIMTLFLGEAYEKPIQKFCHQRKIEGRLIILGMALFIVLLFGIYGIGFEVSDFIYSKF